MRGEKGLSIPPTLEFRIRLLGWAGVEILAVGLTSSGEAGVSVAQHPMGRRGIQWPLAPFQTSYTKVSRPGQWLNNNTLTVKRLVPNYCPLEA